MDKKISAFFVVSNWKNDLSWIEKYTKQYVIYDKSDSLLAGEKVVKVPNLGYNIGDYMDYIITNYNHLPDTIAFLQGHPFDHCSEKEFDRIINNKNFTPLEDYYHIPESYAHRKDPVDNGYMEINNSWYVQAHVHTYGARVNKYLQIFDQFMNIMFSNYIHLDWIRFAPGAQYIVPKENILKYSIDFYKKIMGFVDYCDIPSEGHIIERAMYYIFSGKYEEKNDNK